MCGAVACVQPKAEPQSKQKPSQKPKVVWVLREDGSVQCGGAGVKEGGAASKKPQSLEDGKMARWPW